MGIKNLGRTSDNSDLRTLLEGSSQDSEKHGKKRSRSWKIAGPLIIICAVVAVLVAADYALNSGRIYSGVEVGTISLGGKTPAEAQELVEERTTGALQEFDFTGPDNFQFAAEEVGVDFDVAATVDEAYSVGRRGSMLDRLAERTRGIFTGIQVEPEVNYQPEMARVEVENVAAQLNEPPTEATVEIVGSEVQVTDSAQGYETDVPATMESVNRAVEDMTGNVEIAGEVLKPEITTGEAEKAAEKAEKATAGEVVLQADGEQWTLSPADVGSTLDIKSRDGGLQVEMNRDRMKERLGGVYESLNVDAQEASYDLNGSQISVVPSRTGKEIEDGELLGAMEQGIFEGQREYQVPVVATEPELTTAKANELMPTDVLGSYRTNYGIVPDDGLRRENLEIASNAVNGTLVAPGDVFSMNAHVSDQNYNTTKVIIEGQETKADGGGLCQVTSTLYMAANFAGLDVVERHPHNAQLPYIRPGLDSTVWWGGPGTADDLDMKFQNNTDGYLLLQEYVANDGYIYADIYGKPNDTEVSMDSKPLYKGADYSQWVTYKTVTKNGETLFDGQLHKDTYYPLTDTKGKTIKPKDVYVPPVNP
ncbi:MAG: VanW family protein [Rubrobacteraceae bacterium]